MFLIVTNKTDLACDFLVLKLRQRGIEFIRLNTEDFGVAWDVHFLITESGGEFIVTCVDGTKLRVSDITASYIRQPLLPDIGNDIAAEDRDFARREIAETLKSMWRFIDDEIWLNAPRWILIGGNKPDQLVRATGLGFNIPQTCICSNWRTAREFYHEQQGNVVAKAVRSGFWADQDSVRIGCTRRINMSFWEETNEFASIPMIFQREIDKSYDIRVTVVGENVYSAAIFSQEHGLTEVDWRIGSQHGIELRHESITIPKTLSERCVSLTKSYRLRYSAIDLVLSRSGEYYFLEMNPNGQWAWLEQLVGLPIRESILEVLGYGNVEDHGRV